MSVTTIVSRFRVNGDLTDADTAVLADAGNGYGVRRTDTLGVVVPAGTALVRQSTGVYALSFEDPAPMLTYAYVARFTYGGVTVYDPGERAGGADAANNLYTLVHRVWPYVSGPGEDVLRAALRDAAHEFFRDTGCWWETLDAVDSVAGQAVYAVSTGYDATIRRMRAVRLDGVETAWWFNPVTDEVTLASAPQEADLEVVCDVVLAPRVTCATYPQALLDVRGWGVVHRAVELLKRQADRPWADRHGAELAQARYQSEVNDAKRWAVIGREPATVQMRPRRFVR